MEEKTVSSELKLNELSRQNFRQTINQLHDRASSVLLLTLQWKEIEDHFKSIQLGIEQRAKEVNSVHDSVEQKLNEIKIRENELELVKESVSTREKEFELMQKKEIQERKVQVEWIEKSRNELDAVRASIDKKLADVKDEEKKIELRNKTRLIELKTKEKELELEDIKLKKRIKEIGRVRREFTHVKSDSAMEANHVSFRVTMDGKALIIFLNDYCNDRDSIRQELLSSLCLSKNPAKIVLEAVQGFYKGGLGFDEGIARGSCVFLLEILMQIRPEIRHDVRSEAMELSLDWIKRMKKDSEDSVEVLGCLLLLGSYRLASGFDADELFRCLKIVAHHSQALELLRALDLADKVSGFLQNLVKQNKHIEAIRFIYDFELVNEFPLVPLLEDYMNICRNAITNSRMRVKSIQGRIVVTSALIDDMKAALKCMEDCKIESELYTKCLKQQIDCLEKANANRKTSLPSSAADVCDLGPKSTETPSVICPTPPSGNGPAPASVPAPSPSQKLSGNKRPRSAISAKDDQDAFVSSASAVNSTQMPSQQLAESSDKQDIIQGLIKRNQRIEAIKNIYESEMTDKFSPVDLLRDHMTYLKSVEKSFTNQYTSTTKSQIRFVGKEIDRLRAVINCITTYKLESEFSSKDLKERVLKLEKKRRVLTCSKTKRKPVTRSETAEFEEKKENSGCSSIAAPTIVSPILGTASNAASATEQPSPATKQFSSAANAASTTEQPSLAAKQPSSGTKKASPATEKPSPATHQPSSATKQPSAATKKPSPATKKPSPATKQPSPATEQPSLATKKPSPATKQLSPATKQLSPATKQPSSAAISKTKENKVNCEDPKPESKNQKQRRIKSPRTMASLRKPRESANAADYYRHPQYGGQYVYDGVPYLNSTAAYHNLGGYPSANSQLNPHYSLNYYYNLNAQRPSSSSYHTTMHPWGP
ncbi:FRIGIDA-like protein 5 [Mercurialis annua]|uniref:FRIGIDA-like protein 5 n=1 Tax=Mercurialis annua TaxID=3986 RepID=UPI002160CA84|nr:FRIGIDA-like protein 5 [Mercurialis annua]